ncbi:ROK family transcriptional regulator [Microlunatus soli]|uniref:Sugar kinase of the NBD/HSP70 family, may contain an N-terminal HTH domain n=1 Tax=Microlunatus soli TaxID=630515 RepID=A0A1H1M5J5_9ACTN|nr:ROK family protein [Microlunatus soli]SDR82016.1 Sugar kinase of the NBD/HSP70 family, may contain an N-terminal HTH domain [Microlunatus soli]
MSGADRAAAAVRQANARDCLLSLRDTGVPMTVGELALHTGLSRPTVDAVLAELVAHGTVQPSTRSEANAPGRPARRFVFEPAATLVAGVDVGARSIRCTISDAAGTVLARSVVPSAPEECPDRIDAIVRTVRNAVARTQEQLAADDVDDDHAHRDRPEQADEGDRADDRERGEHGDDPYGARHVGPAGRHAGPVDQDRHEAGDTGGTGDDDIAAGDGHDTSAEESPERLVPQLAAVGLAVPGVLDHQDRITQSLTVPEWVGIDLKGQLAERLGCAVSIENDIKLAALAEHHFGDNIESLIYVQIGNRISVSVVIDGKILQGSHRLAGELGTQRGMRWTETSQRGELRWSTGDQAEEVFRRAAAGNHDAQSEISLFCAEIAPKIAPLLLAIDPERLIIGGGLSRAGEALLDPLRRHINHLLTGDDKPELSLAQLTSDGVVIGALGHTFEQSSTDIFGIAGVPAPWTRLRTESKPTPDQENRT